LREGLAEIDFRPSWVEEYSVDRNANILRSSSTGTQEKGEAACDDKAPIDPVRAGIGFGNSKCQLPARHVKIVLPLRAISSQYQKNSKVRMAVGVAEPKADECDHAYISRSTNVDTLEGCSGTNVKTHKRRMDRLRPTIRGMIGDR
jgi:hypothetical protein